MASGVNVKMGVSGVAQFKQNMNQAKQAVKTLDAQLALTEKQFKQSGDAESYMTEKSALLEAKLENQKAVLANTEKALEEMTKNGVDRASKAYQDMYRQMINAKSAVIDTENAMNGIAEAGDEASDSVSEMNSQLSSIGKGVAWENVTDGLEKITSGMGKVIKKAWDVGKAIADATLGAGAWADELQTTADQYEISPEKLYRMRQVADLIDTDADTIISAQDKLARNNSKQSKEFMGALSFLGIDPTGKKNIDLFWEAGEAIMALGENEDKAYYAQEVFGKSWRELLPLFKAGRTEYDKAFNEASWIGDDNFKNLTELDDASQKLNNSWETLQQTFLATLAGPMKDVFELLNDVLSEFNEYLQSEEGKEALRQMGETIKTLIEDLVNINPADVANGLKTVVEDITKAFEWIKEHKGDIVLALEAIGGAFVALKLGTVASNIAKIVSGFRTLWNGADKPLPNAPSVPTTGAEPATKTTLLSTIGAKIMPAVTKAGNAAIMYGGALGAVGDMFMNQTNMGRALRDGTDVFEGLKTDVQELSDNIKHNSETFADNWDPSNPNANIIAQWFGDRSQNADAATRLESGANWAPSYMGGQSPTGNAPSSSDWLAKNILQNRLGYWSQGEGADRVLSSLGLTQESVERMEKQAEDITGAAEKQEKSADEMSKAADTLEKMPAQVEAAIISGLSGVRIYIDGQQMSNAIQPYMNAGMGGNVLKMTK